MEKIDAAYIKKRLTGRRGEQAELARALGIDNDKMSKILSGQRRVQPDEVQLVQKYFESGAGLGLADGSAAFEPSPGDALPMMPPPQTTDLEEMHASGANDVRISVIDDRLAVTAIVDKKGIEVLKRMIELWEKEIP